MSDLRAWHRWLGRRRRRACHWHAPSPAGRICSSRSSSSRVVPVAAAELDVAPGQSRAALQRTGRGKARDFNWHNVIGVWSAVPLFIVVVSAVPISFPWANAAVYRAVGEVPPAGRGGGGAAARGDGPARGAGRARGEAANGGGRGGAARRDAGGREEPDDAPTPAFTGLNALLARAEHQVPGWRTINLRTAGRRRRRPLSSPSIAGDGGQPHLRSTLTLDRVDRRDRRVTRHFASLTLGRRIRNVMRFAHTGEVLGIPGQTIAGLVSAGAVVLVWTGLALALRRFRAWIGRRSRQPEFVTDSDRSSAA